MNRILLAYITRAITSVQEPIDGFNYQPHFVEAMSRSLSVSQNPRGALFATSQRLSSLIAGAQHVEVLRSDTTTLSFDRLIIEYQTNLQTRTNYGLEDSNFRAMMRLLVRLSAVYDKVITADVLGRGTSYKFQISFAGNTSEMYFIENVNDLKKSILNILVKFYEQVYLFANEIYADAGIDGITGRDDVKIEELISRRNLLEGLDNINEEILEVDEELEEERLAEMAALDVQIDTLAVVVQDFDVTTYLLNYRNNRGRWMPKELRLPKEISRSVINPINKDHYCFFHCLNIHKSYTEGPSRPALLQYADPEKEDAIEELNTSITVTYPYADEFYNAEGEFKYSPANIGIVEQDTNININVYNLSFENDMPRITCDYRSNFKHTDNDSVCRLLYVPYSMMSIQQDIRSEKNRKKLIEEWCLQREGDLPEAEPYYSYSKKDNGHFVYIPECSKLLYSDQITANNRGDIHLCPHCDVSFYGDTPTFKRHKEDCKVFMSTKSNTERMCKFVDNEADAYKEFTNYHQLTKQSWICYADTETVTKKDGEFVGHKLIAYMLYLKCNYDESLSKKIIRCAVKEDDDMQYNFARDILNLRCYVYQHNGVRHRYLKEREKRDYLEHHLPEHCAFCETPFEVDEGSYIEDYMDSEDVKMTIALKKKSLNGLPKEDLNARDVLGKDIKAYEAVLSSDYTIHHCHNTGAIVGYLCPTCNKKEAKSQQSFSVAFHNLPYDLLTLLTSFAENEIDGVEYMGESHDGVTTANNLEVIAQSSMKYSTITIGRECVKLGRKSVYLPAVKFIDSFRFISQGLSNIINTMKKDGSTFPNTRQYIMENYKSEELFGYATQKGLIAYDHINLENLKHKGNLPKECYENSLTMDYTAEGPVHQRDRMTQAQHNAEIELTKDYERTNEVYKTLEAVVGPKMRYRDYFLFYLELDIMLLADYFESLRDQLIASHKIDPAYHQGLASYSQNCFLYHTKTKLHLIEPVDVSKTIVDNCRGGYSGIMKRMSENFTGDTKKLLKYLDANNLYGYSMIQKLANKFIGVITPEEFETERAAWTRDGDFAYFLLCDYTVPIEIHDKFAKFAPLISKKTVICGEISIQNKTLKEVKSTAAGTKLCSTLESGENYLMDYENYLFYIRMGYQITIKSVQKYEQEYILKDYIDMNSGLRQRSTTEINKQLYKDLNNICYGKSLQNPMKYSNIELLTNPRVVHSRIHNPLLKRCEVLVDEKLVLTDLYHATMKFDTCIQYGFHILEKSKLHMYTTLYEKIAPFCEEHSVTWDLLMHDTDSFCFEFGLEGSPFANEKEFILALHAAEDTLFDLHLYEDPEIKDTSRKKVVGYFLDEYSDSFELVGFVGLAAKSYCYVLKDVRKTVNGKPNEDYGKLSTKIKGKGMRTSYLQTMFTYQDYKAISQNGKIDGNSVKFRNIVKKNFANVIADVTKIALSSYDDKWHIYKEDGVLKYLPYGHYKIAGLE